MFYTEENNFDISDSTVNTQMDYLKSLMEYVPGGLVVYEWDGKILKALCISKYFQEKYGKSSISKDGPNNGNPDFSRIYKNDLANYKAAINKALTETRHLEYAFRIYSDDEKGYRWVLINAISKPKEDGKDIVYAMYSDITNYKTTEHALKKNQRVLNAALKASLLLCYEYDPIKHEAISLTPYNIFGLPEKIDNFPHSIEERNNIHPEDRDIFLNTVKKIDLGEKTASCDVRIKQESDYKWVNFKFDAYLSPDKNYNVAIIIMNDISARMKLLKTYEERLNTLVTSHEKALWLGIINLTRNTFSVFDSSGIQKSSFPGAETYDKLVLQLAEKVTDIKDKALYLSTFDRNSLIKRAMSGENNVSLEHLYTFSDDRIEWIRSTIEIIVNPITGDYEGIAFAKSINADRLSALFLQKTLKQDFLMAAIFFENSDDYYLCDVMNNNYFSLKHDLWNFKKHSSKHAIFLNDIIVEDFKEKVLSALRSGMEYEYAFDSVEGNKTKRLELRFFYLDPVRKIICASIRNITDNVLLEKLRFELRHDMLTNLYNRNATFKKCRLLLVENPDKKFVMIHFDIKRFRLYNSFFGYKIADQLLCDIADGIRKIAEEYALISYGRINGDVFCVFVSYENDSYLKLIEKLIKSINEYRNDFQLEAAIGIYKINNSELSVESMFNRASLAAKESKKNRGDSYIIYDDYMENSLIEEQMILNDMQKAIDEEQFKVYLQPKFSLNDNKVIGAEALVRWNHPNKGMISPSKFIPIFEEKGLIFKLDQYMLKHVCILIRKWLDEGKNVLPISINISRVTLYNRNTTKYLIELVKKYNIDSKYLELELTESAYMDNPDDMKIQLEELKNAGFKILMDDFGAGYSSLNTLKELSVDYLKLDMKFLSINENESKGRTVLLSIIRMAKLLQIPVIVEGVENKAQASFLNSIGCEFVQGFLFAKPMPAEDYCRFIENNLNNNEKEIQDTLNGSVYELLSKASPELRVLIENIPNPIAIIEYNSDDFMFLHVNPYFMKIFGLQIVENHSSNLFIEHLNSKTYDLLIEKINRCIDLQSYEIIELEWHDKSLSKFIMNMKCVDQIGESAIILVSFTDVTSLQKVA